MIVNDPLYKLYALWLEWQVKNKKISHGRCELLKISESNFINFKSKYKMDTFKNSLKALSRRIKIDSILNQTGL